MNSYYSKIEQIVLKYFNTTREELMSKSRKEPQATQRQIMYYSLSQCGMTEREIAKEYSISCSLVNYAKSNVASWMRFNRSIGKQVSDILAQIRRYNESID